MKFKEFEERRCPLCGKFFYAPTIADSPFCYECRNKKPIAVIKYEERKKGRTKKRLEELLSNFKNPSSRVELDKELVNILKEEFYKTYGREPTDEELIPMLEEWISLVRKNERH